MTLCVKHLQLLRNSVTAAWSQRAPVQHATPFFKWRIRQTRQAWQKAPLTFAQHSRITGQRVSHRCCWSPVYSALLPTVLCVPEHHIFMKLKQEGGISRIDHWHQSNSGELRRSDQTTRINFNRKQHHFHTNWVQPVARCVLQKAGRTLKKSRSNEIRVTHYVELPPHTFSDFKANTVLVGLLFPWGVMNPTGFLNSHQWGEFSVLGNKS